MIHYFFGWYTGGIWSNLIASILWVIPGYLWGRFHARQIHSRLDEHHAYNKKAHDKIKDIHDHLNPDHPFTLGNSNGRK